VLVSTCYALCGLPEGLEGGLACIVLPGRSAVHSTFIIILGMSGYSEHEFLLSSYLHSDCKVQQKDSA